MSLFDRMLGDSNECLPTNEQLTLARRLGIEIRYGVSMEQLSRQITRARQKQARSGKPFPPPGEETDEIKPPTAIQLADARALGIDISDDMGFEQVAALLERASVPGRPFRSQLKMCQELGMEVDSDMTRGQVDVMLDQARSDVRYAGQLRQIEQQTQSTVERQQRKRFGNDLVDNMQRWNARQHKGQYLVIFRGPRGIVVNLAVFRGARIAGAARNETPFVGVRLCMPIISQDDHGADRLDWDIDVEIAAREFLYLQHINKEIGEYDIPHYYRILAVGEEHAATLAGTPAAEPMAALAHPGPDA